MTQECRILTIEPQNTMSVRGSMTLAELVTAIGDFLTEAEREIKQQHGQIIGYPFTRYHNVDGDKIDLEGGLPVASSLQAGQRAKPNHLPGGEVAVITHFGPYDGLVTSGDALAQWVTAQGREAAGPNWEFYVTDPGAEPDPAQWRTDIFMPLKPKHLS